MYPFRIFVSYSHCDYEKAQQVNWHAPTVMARLRSFDREFAEFYRQSGLAPGASRQAAIAEIEKLLAS
jgi:hypothetical protein